MSSPDSDEALPTPLAQSTSKHYRFTEPPPWFPVLADDNSTHVAFQKYQNLPQGEPRREYLRELRQLEPARKKKKNDPAHERDDQSGREREQSTPRAAFRLTSPTDRITLTDRQKELRPLVAAQLELLAFSKDATILDMRIVYDAWLRDSRHD